MIDTELFAVQMGIKRVARKILTSDLDDYLSNLGELYHILEGDYLYIGKNEADVQAARDAEAAVNQPMRYKNEREKQLVIDEHVKSQRLLGKLFSYPDCCVEAYISHFLESVKEGRQPNYMMNTISNSKGRIFDWRYNNLGKERLYNYFPCSYQCKATYEYISELMEDKRLDGFHEEQKEAFMVWSEDSNIGFIGSGKIENFHYKSFRIVGKVPVRESTLKKADHIRSDGRKSVIYNKDKIFNRNDGAMVIFQ